VARLEIPLLQRTPKQTKLEVRARISFSDI
jgi:hypothetical protein